MDEQKRLVDHAAGDGSNKEIGDPEHGEYKEMTADFVDPSILKTSLETGLTSEEASERLRIYGFNELPEKEESLILKFLSFFWGPMPIMIWLAALVEFIQCLSGRSEHWPDFGVLLGLQFINGTVAFFEEYNAGNAIAELKASLAPKANVKRDGKFSIVNARELVPGDVIVLQIGGVIPADAKLMGDLSLQVDQAALTGESLPVTLHKNETAKMGSTVKRGEMDAIVVKTGKDTFFGRAAGMVAQVEQQGRFQKVLFNVMVFLMALASVLVIIILVILIIDNGTSSGDVLTSVGTAVVLLIASIPIAMQVVATVTMAVGASILASKKAIVARLSAIEELAGMHTLCSDKTGTLTLNKLQLDDPILFDSKMDADRLFFISALAAKRLDEGQDAIDTCIMNKALESVPKAQMMEYKQVAFIPFDPSIKRTEATIEHPKEGKFKVTKGATPQILEMCENRNRVEQKALMKVNDLADRGYRALGVAQTDEHGVFQFKGILSLFDPPRVDTKATIEMAQEMGVQVKMITGDHTAIAIETARRLGMGSTIHSINKMREAPEADVNVGTGSTNRDDMILAADGFAEVLPEDKYKIVEVLQQSGQIVGMTGDGVNDAPALKKAEIGIAVEGATDAARAAADIVLTEPGLSVIITAMNMSRKIFQRVRNYCIFRIAGTIQLIFFFFTAVFYRPNQHFDDADDQKNFRLPVLAVVLITLVNDACVLTISRDNVIPAKDPQAWHLKEVFLIAAILGFTAMVESVLLLQIGFSAGDEDRKEGIACIFFDHCTASYGQVQSLIFLNLCLSDFITVFAARTRGFFFTRRPALALMGAGLLATLSMTFVVAVAQLGTMKTINLRTIVMVWVYAILWFFVQDFMKVIGYWIVDTCKIVDRSAYLNLVKSKQKSRLDPERAKKYSQALRKSMHKASIDYAFQAEHPVAVGGYQARKRSSIAGYGRDTKAHSLLG